MNSQITVLDSSKMDTWDNFVASHELGSIYHTSLWQETIKNTYGHQPVYITLVDDRGKIKAGLPIFVIKSKITSSRLSTAPCAQYCNPLVANQYEYDQLINFALHLMKRYNLKYYELKTSESFYPEITKLGQVVNNYSTHLLDLDRPIETIKKSFHKSCIQRAIKKSDKFALKHKVASSLSDVKSFYRLFAIMRKKYGLLSQPYKFFSTMWTNLRNNNHIDILHAKYNGQIISSILLLKYKDTVTYEFGASIADMLYLRPNHFLLWEAIQRTKSQGYRKFDFGRTSADNKNLSVFKSRWGTTRKMLPYYYIPDIKGISSIRQKNVSKEMMYHTVKYLPYSLSQLIGNLLYRHLV
jgi:lipid II:glycine glycyltransferase (peptidoglycan interpeptide bridge formation enzyme)